MGHTETSHMDAHGEASLQSLMEWAARLENLVENLAETPETNQGHYAQFHRGMDQLDHTTRVVDDERSRQCRSTPPTPVSNGSRRFVRTDDVGRDVTNGSGRPADGPTNIGTCVRWC